MSMSHAARKRLTATLTVADGKPQPSTFIVRNSDGLVFGYDDRAPSPLVWTSDERIASSYDNEEQARSHVDRWFPGTEYEVEERPAMTVAEAERILARASR